MAKPIGLSFRRGPFGWSSEELDLIVSFRFGLWDIPEWMIRDRILIPGPATRCIVSDIYAFGTLNNVALDGTEKMRQELVDDFANTIEILRGYKIRQVSLDFGLTTPPDDIDNDAMELRFSLLRRMWEVCHRNDIQLLMPVTLPLPSPEHDRWINYVLQRAMCTHLGLVGDVQVHRIKKIPVIDEILGRNRYDYRLLRLCWNAEDGNVIAKPWFEPWAQWIDHNPLRVPILFEPTHHQQLGFIQHARNVAELAGQILPSPIPSEE